MIRRVARAAITLTGIATSRYVANFRAARRSRTLRKRLWMVNHYAVTSDLPGGTRHSDLAEILQDHGWDTVIYTSSFNHNTHRFERPISFPGLVTTETTPEATWKWLPTVPYESNDWRRYLGMLSFTGLFVVNSLFQKRPDVVLGSSGHLLAPFGAWLTARWYGAPFLLEIRDVWPDSLIELGLSNRYIIATLRALERFLYQRADKIIVVADGIGDRLIGKGVSPEKIVSLPHGVKVNPTELNTTARENFRAELGWTDKTVAIWAGGIQPMNGLDTLIDAARLLQHNDDLLIVLVGDGSEKQVLRNRASDLGNVRFYDSVPKSQIVSWLEAADIGVMTSRKFDSFTGTRPRKMLDYMAAGLPVVCAIPGEASRVIDEAGSGVTVDWERPDILADALGYLAGSAELRARMGCAGREAIETVHSLLARGQQFASMLIFEVR